MEHSRPTTQHIRWIRRLIADNESLVDFLDELEGLKQIAMHDAIIALTPAEWRKAQAEYRAVESLERIFKNRVSEMRQDDGRAEARAEALATMPVQQRLRRA